MKMLSVSKWKMIGVTGILLAAFTNEATAVLYQPNEEKNPLMKNAALGRHMLRSVPPQHHVDLVPEDPITDVKADAGLRGLAFLKAKADKKFVCHLSDDSIDNTCVLMYKTLEIGANAVSSHLAHGDKEGKCSVVCNALCSQNNDECYQYRSISNSAEECWCNLNPKYVCGPNTECKKVGDINKCQCKQGYEGNATDTTIGCTDINECANETLYDCNSNAQCVNIPGGYDCVCRAGYTGDGKGTGTGCTNVNECQPPNVNSCDANATCIDKPGFYLCECNEGYTGDGWKSSSGDTGCTRVCDKLFTTETQSKNFDASNPTVEFVFGGLPDAEGSDGKNVKVITETTADINADGEYFIITQAENNKTQNVELGKLGENSTAQTCYQSSRCCTENRTFTITATNFRNYKSDGALTIQFDATDSVTNNGEFGNCTGLEINGLEINDNTKVTLEYYPSCSSCRYIYIPELERTFNRDEPEINFVFNQLPKAQPNTTVTFTVMVHADINDDNEYFLVREAESDVFIAGTSEASRVGQNPQDCDTTGSNVGCCTEWKTFTMTAEAFNSYASDGDVTIQLDATNGDGKVDAFCDSNMASVSIRYITCPE